MVYSKVNLHKIINQSVSLFKYKTSLRNLDIVTKISKNIPFDFVTDEKRVK